MNRKSLESRLLEKARSDADFRRRLIAEPARTIGAELGLEIPSSLKLRVLQETDREMYLVLPSPTRLADLAPPDAGAVVGGLRGKDAEKDSDPNNEKTLFP